MEKYNNPYWYTRGLCAAFILGKAAGRDQWAASIHAEVEAMTSKIRRSDWLELIDTFGISNTGLWLFGY
jgi:hypothetical protein